MVVPNVFICGAPKAGTTALSHYLKQHPDIFLPEKKETQFFSDWETYQQGIEWLSDMYYAGHSGETVIGEASPQTMAAPGAPHRIARHSPDARLIFLLRDPVDRMFSHYHYEVRNGRINPLRSFSDRIRIPSCWRRNMIRQGLYYDHLRRFEDSFDRSQMLPILSSNLKTDTEKVLRRIFDFIDVDASVPINTLQRRNVTYYPTPESVFKVVWGSLFSVRSALGTRFFDATRSWVDPVRRLFFLRKDTEAPHLSSDDRSYLATVFAPWNDRLAAYLDRDLSHWSAPDD
jgi:hypothetical protein